MVTNNSISSVGVSRKVVLSDHLLPPRAGKGSLPIPILQDRGAVLEALLMSKGCSGHFMQVKMALEQGYWMKNNIFVSFLVMVEMQLWEVGKTCLSLGKTVKN